MAGQNIQQYVRDEMTKAALEAGIQISQLTLTLVIPPRSVMKSFQGVQSAQSAAGKAKVGFYTTGARAGTVTLTAGEKVLLREQVALGQVSEDLVSSLASRLARIDSRIAAEARQAAE